MRLWLQHHLNALHIMGRLIRLGCTRPRARTAARRWEAIVHPWLYGCPTASRSRPGAGSR